VNRYVGCTLAALSLFLLLCIPTQAAEQPKVISLRFATFVTPMHRVSINLDLWAKEVEKRTNGRVRVTMYPSGSLSPAGQIYDSVTKGIADIGYAAISYTAGRFPLTDVVTLPLGYTSGYEATTMANELYKKFKPKEFEQTQIMWLEAHGPGILHTKRPVNKLEDVKGMRIRSTGATTRIALALGAAPVGMPMSDAYDALSRGIVEGIFCPMEALQGWKLGEVVSHTTEDYGASYSDCFYIAMNREKWNSIPEDVKPIVEKINQEWLEKQGKMWDEIDKEGREFVLKRGNKIISLPKEENARWAEKVRPTLDDYVKTVKAKGLPGDEALKFCLDYLKAHQK
jgi:TRAP-type C4-dicarboxylate transport system substrate-binding protein